MEYEKRILCYFDILGFSEKVCQNALDATTIDNLFSELKKMIDDRKEDHIIISHFSDSFIISIKHRSTDPTQLRIAINILIKLLEYNLLARGAIVYGNIIHTQENIYGPAIVKAVSLEKTEKYSRILLDESLDELPLPTIGNASITYRSFFNDYKFVKTDEIDKKFYIDFISEINSKENKDILTQNIKNLIESGVKNEKEKISEKYVWLKRKYEDYLKTLTD